MTRVNGVELGPNSPARNLRTCRSESAEEQLCDDFIARLTTATKKDVVQFSQAQASQQTPGVSDRRYRIYGVAFWFEVKADDGQLTKSQHEFLLQELACGALGTCGNLADLERLVMLLQSTSAVDRASGRVEREGFVREYCEMKLAEWAQRGYRKERTR